MQKLKTERLEFEELTSLEYVCHLVTVSKIEKLLECGLPDNWQDIILSPVISDDELKKEHIKVRENCTNSSREKDDPAYCKTPNACDQCKMFDKTHYSIGGILGERGDVLLYPSEKDRDTFDRLFDGLTTALSLLAFVPGGVPGFWGYSYEVCDR